MAPEDAYGPVFITSKSSLSQTGQPLALAANPINFKAYPFVLPADMTAETGEPTQIDAIWRCARVPESEDKITLKSAQDRFLACDQVGVVSAEREARGAQEEFIFIPMHEHTGRGAFALQSAAFGKYLGVDEVAGGKLELRCDADTIGEDEVSVQEAGGPEERGGKTRKWTIQTGTDLDILGHAHASLSDPNRSGTSRCRPSILARWKRRGRNARGNPSRVRGS